MSLRGYKPKTKPALWRSAFPEQMGNTVGFVEKPNSKEAKASALKIIRQFWRKRVRVHVFKRIRPVSKRRAKSKAAYREAARLFVAAAVALEETCPVVDSIKELKDGYKYGHPISNRLNEVHHIRGRVGRLEMDSRYWMAVSKQGHRWIHKNPAKAKARGWLGGMGEWGVCPPIKLTDGKQTNERNNIC